MKRDISILLLIISVMVFISCGQPTPKEMAEAEAIRADTAMEKQREDMRLRKDQLDYEIKGAIKDDWIAFWKNVIWWGAIVTCVCMGATGLCWCYFIAYRGGRAIAVSAGLRASQIHVDKHTRMYPGIVRGDRIYLPALGESRNLNQDTLPDPQLVAIHHRLAEVGVLAEAIITVSKATKNASPADMLPSTSASVPTLESGGKMS
jgi:hypothetical protein